VKHRTGEVLRYFCNGVIATLVHYSVLFSLINFVGIGSVGIANLMASTVGIAVSFVGNRYFVFRSYEEPAMAQAIRFAGLYSLIAITHGTVLFVWADYFKLNYNFGFILAIGIQMFMGYFGGKRHVFTRKI
jgi:putative flippase GtrA